MDTAVTLDLPIRQVLLGDVSAEESTATLQRRLAPDTVDELLAGTSSALRGAARTEVGRVIDDILRMDTLDAVMLGWRKHRLLTEAARRTVASPDRREVVELARHRIAGSYQPRIDVFVDNVKVGQIDLALNISATVIGMCGVVSDGRLVALRSGHIDLAAILRCEGLALVKGERRIDLAAETSLGEGIQLVDGSEAQDGRP
jgi:hypothetical protein